MDGLSIYKIWAPDDARWTAWAKPVLFARLPQSLPKWQRIPEVKSLPEFSYDTMIIVDLPSDQGVNEGLLLAGRGYRPVPLYNGVNESKSHRIAVNVKNIVKALCANAELLETYQLRADAPPAFLLDADRMRSTGKLFGQYDNRWCVFPQDMPSAAFLLKNRIKKVVVRSERVQDDLSHILCRYQAAGLAIYLDNEKSSMEQITVKKPRHFKSLFYRFKVISGLRRNATGGFGGMVPEPSSSSG